MHLLYFSRAYTEHDRRFLQEFAGRGIRTTFLSLLPVEASIARLGLPAQVGHAGSLGAADAERYAARLGELRPDVVLAGPIHDCGFIATRSRDVPTVLQSWAFDVYWEMRRDAHAAQRGVLALRACAGLFTDSEAVLEECRRISDRPFASALVMPWGVELERLRNRAPGARLRERLGLTSRTVFVSTRGLAPIYGTRTLLEAMREVHGHAPRAALVMAGDGPLRSRADAFVRKHRLRSAVILLGALRREAVWDLFAAADFYVSASRCDGTSISLLEAMAHRLPVVVSDIPGNRGWVTPRRNGWLAPAGHSAQFAARMRDAIGLSRLQRRAIGERNCRTIERRADWARNFGGLTAFLAACAASADP
jgi:glycosyltransferase involved in cell wall biosynthesis